MQLYESLINNVGIGLGKYNSDYVESLFRTGITSPFQRFLEYIGASDTEWVTSYMNRESGEDFTFSFSTQVAQYEVYKDRKDDIGHAMCYRPVIYKGKPHAKDYNVKGTAHITVYELNERAFCILDRVPELKDTYKKLDQLFKKYDKDEWNWEFDYGTLPVRIYYWKDSKFNFEEVIKYERK